MLRIGIERRAVEAASVTLEITLEVVMKGTVWGDVGVAPDNHVFVLLELNLGIKVMSSVHVVSAQKDVVMVMIDRKGALKQGPDAIS